MKFSRLSLFLLFFLIGKIVTVSAQATGDLSNNNTVRGIQPRGREIPKSKKVKFIIKSDTRKILYGNKCVEEFTREMGFLYLVIPKGQPGYESEIDRFFHNFTIKTRLFFTKGPFWKIKVKKRIKDCREKTGDFVG